MSRSFRGNKRGVSEVIASLIILLIVSLAGAGLYSYSLTTFSSTGDSFRVQTEKKAEQAREQLVILAVWWDLSNKLNLTVLNYGAIDLAVDMVYVNGIVAATYLSGTGVKILPGDMVTVKLDSPVLIVSGQVYEIIVVSERGSKNEVSWQA